MEVYVVGGAVRDMLLGIEAKDVDYVVVGATHDDMIAKGFKKVGADFPVYLHPETGDEWALARTERKSGKGYNGFTTETDGVSLEDDLARRDLTMNAMALVSPVGIPVQISSMLEVIDPYSGREDLKNGILRHVSPAFADDPLRVLRVARFAARYGFEVAPETLELCRTLVTSGELATISKERFWKEMDRALAEPHPAKFFEVLEACGALWNEAVPFFYESFKDKDRLKYSLFYKPAPKLVYATASEFARMDGKAISRNKVGNDVVKLSRTYAKLDELLKDGAFKMDGTAIADWLKSINTDELFADVLDCIYIEWAGDSGFYLGAVIDDCRFACTSVKAADLLVIDPTLEGKALGDAINKARAAAVRNAIENFKP